MKLSKIVPLLICAVAAFTEKGVSQTVEDMTVKFPGKMAVMSSINRQLEISMKDGLPFARSSEVSEMMILDDKVNGVFNKNKIYHSSFNELKKLEAYTLVADGNSTKKMKVSEFKTQSAQSESVFYDDRKETVFDYPKLTRGSIAHVESEFYNKDIRFITPFYFSHYLPINNASYSIVFPEDVEVRYLIKNDDKKTIQVTESQKGRKKKIEFTATQINNLDYFASSPSISYYAPHVIVYIASYKKDDAVNPVFGSVDELYKWNAHFLEGINTAPDAALKQLADSIGKGKSSSREKAAAIYSWVQAHIKYVAFEEGLEGFIPRQAADIYHKRYGDCKDMASLLTALLKLSGVDAHFVWIGTRHIPYSYSEVPLPITDNHMICAAKIDNEWIFLDATDPHCIFGYPTSMIQDKQALVSSGPDKYELVKVPIIAPEKNNITDSTFLSIQNNTLKGNCSVRYTGYFGSDLYNNLQQNKEDDERVYVRRRMSKGSNKFIMNDYKINYTDPAKREAVISSNFDIPDYVKTIGDEIYINLNLERLLYGAVIDTAKRKAPVETEFMYTIKQVHVLDIPAGYTVNYLPKNTSLSNSFTSLRIEYEQRPGKVIATQYYTVNNLYIQAGEFTQWNNILSKALYAYKEQVVLQKK